MELLKAYALSMLGTPYKFGGNNPIDGIDCSGYVCELLRSAGLLGKEDLSAQGLYDKFSEQENTTLNERVFGALIFFGKSTSEISHVAWGWDSFRMLEAGGGDRLTLTKADAAAKNAFVRPRPIEWRSDLVAILKPSYSKINTVRQN